MRVTIFHNPDCTKSRGTLALLRERGIEPEIVEYLRHPPDAAAVQRLADLLGVPPMGLVRRQEAAFTEAGLDQENVDDATVADAVARYPQLLERPIVVVDDARAAIGRPPERVLDIL
jgi:arsenate reductase